MLYLPQEQKNSKTEVIKAAAQGITEKVPALAPAVASALLLFLVSPHSMEAATAIKGAAETVGLQDVSIPVDLVKNFLEILGWLPIYVYGALGFSSGFSNAREEVHDPGTLAWIDGRNAALKAKITEADQQKALGAVFTAIQSGEVPGVGIQKTKEGAIAVKIDPKTKKPTGEEVDISPLVGKTLAEMVKADYGASKLRVRQPDEKWEWLKVSTRIGMQTLEKQAIPAMFLADALLWSAGLTMPQLGLLGIGGPKLLAEGIIATSVMIGHQNTDITEMVRDEMTPTRKKTNTGRN